MISAIIKKTYRWCYRDDLYLLILLKSHAILVFSKIEKIKSLTTWNSCVIILLIRSRWPSRKLIAVHLEEHTTGVFHLCILPPTNVGETTANAKGDNTTRTEFSVFPNISQYTNDSFMTF